MRKTFSNAFEALGSPRVPAVKKKKKRRQTVADSAPSHLEDERAENDVGNGHDFSHALMSQGAPAVSLDDSTDLALLSSFLEDKPPRSLRYSLSASNTWALLQEPDRSTSDHEGVLHAVPENRSSNLDNESQLETLESGLSVSKDLETRSFKAPSPAIDEGELQSISDYLAAEVMPGQIYPTADIVWGQTERAKVYNFLLHVPYQLERVMWFGSLVCLDSFLVYDVICIATVVLATVCVRLVSPGVIYYWLKDITAEFLKITVLFSALELFDKILSNFGVDVMGALAGTCTLWVQGDGEHGQLRKVVQDSVILFCVTFMHAMVIMIQGLVYSVVMTVSKKYALLALLIAGNFVEIKGTVYKKMDTTKLWSLLCLDVLELYHLLIALLFVGVEDMDSTGSWLPSKATFVECSRILAAEVVIDVIKHAVLGKFNDIRPGVYREFMRDFCERVSSSQSHNCHKLVGFFPLGPVVLFMRMAVTLFLMQGGQLLTRLPAALLLWLLLLLVKPLLGYGLKLVAHRYVQYYLRQYGKAVKLNLGKSKDIGRAKKDS